MRELQKRLETMQTTFRTDFPQWANTVLAAKAWQLIRERIRETGKAPDGGNYKPYSTRPLVLKKGMFENTSQSFEKEVKKEAKWFTDKDGEKHQILFGGYKRFRDIRGAQTKHKDFIWTGEMMGSIHVIGTEKVSHGYMTTIGTKEEEQMRKLSANVDREGKEIMKVTKEEEKQLNDMLDIYITNIVKRVMNG